ncbi:MAG: FAD-binding oxidoreductase [candidate division Zixibacteria bacterium]|nr:FAD-binding oxidoreductase [candidate division Zixibacteria bacterium]
MSSKKRQNEFENDRISSAINSEAYTSDGSIYRIEPSEIRRPNSPSDAIKFISQAIISKLSITPRGGGTGLAGGALGRGLVIDLSRLNKIIDIDAENLTVVCQPGIIYQDLNIALKGHNLFFPPDPSSGDSCQIGGMLANNSSGPRSVKYGLTSHYVEELTLVNKSGKPIKLTKLKIDSPEFEAFLNHHHEYKEIFHLIDNNKDAIIRDWPAVKKNSAGYNLKQVAEDMVDGIFNLPALYIGSEGTFGVFLEVKLRLLPLPGQPLLYRLFFASLEDAGEAIEPLLATLPSALEIVDGSTLDLIGREKYSVPDNAEALLLLEYDEDYENHKRQLGELATTVKLSSPPELAENEHERSSLWAARRAIVPILYRHHPTKRPFGFIEDASVPVDKLTEFIGWIRKRLEKDNLTFGLFGHIGDGNLHIRPLLDFHRRSDYQLIENLYTDVYAKIVELGGSSTAEHADGRLRAPVLRDVYTPEIYSLFQRIKKILDPENLLNPDVILSERNFTDEVDFKKLELICAACGKCNGYCPAYEIFKREDMSPRGWLRMLHSNIDDDKQLQKTYEYCLNCKNCTTVCPAGVDIAGEILEFKAKYPNKTAGKAISYFDRKPFFSKWLKAGALFNPVMGSALGRTITGLIGKNRFGMDSKVEAPLPAFRTLRDRHPSACTVTGGTALFHGCADNYFVSASGDSLIEVYHHYGIEVALPKQDCCGLPMEVYGHRDSLIEKAKTNIDSLINYDAIVFTCASCLHRLADYEELFSPGSEYHEKARVIKSRLFDACQYLLQQDITLPSVPDGKQVRVSYHHPCHLKAAKLEQEPLKLLSAIKGISLVHPEHAGRCCGQAGSFGFIHYREGQAIFDRKREEYIKLNPDIIVSSCPSCIAKVRKEVPKHIRVCHPLEIVNDLIRGKNLIG